MECFCGVVQFICCLYVLPVVPKQMNRLGYDVTSSIIATCSTCAIGSMVAGVLTNMPLIVAPPTAVSIFLAVSQQQQGLSKRQGCGAVMMAGAMLALCGIVPIISKALGKVSCKQS